MKIYEGILFIYFMNLSIMEFIIVGKEGNKSEKGQGQRVVMDLVNHLLQDI